MDNMTDEDLIFFKAKCVIALSLLTLLISIIVCVVAYGVLVTAICYFIFGVVVGMIWECF